MQRRYKTKKMRDGRKVLGLHCHPAFLIEKIHPRISEKSRQNSINQKLIFSNILSVAPELL